MEVSNLCPGNRLIFRHA